MIKELQRELEKKFNEEISKTVSKYINILPDEQIIRILHCNLLAYKSACVLEKDFENDIEKIMNKGMKQAQDILNEL